MFKGTYRYRVDPKGRLPVPAPFRRRLADGGAVGVVLTLLDQCLAAYPPDEWTRLEEQLRSRPGRSGPVTALMRLLASRATDCPLDVQGRILVPPALRQATNLGREAVVVGVLNRFEVWHPSAWERFVQDSEQLLADAAPEVLWPRPPASLRPQGKSSR